MAVFVNHDVMASIVKDTFMYLQRLITERVPDQHGEHLAVASALLMAEIVRFQDEPDTALRLINSAFEEGNSPLRVEFLQ